MTDFDRSLVYLSSAVACALVGAVTDVKSRRVPNLLTAPAIVAGLALHSALDGWRGLEYSLFAGLICGGIFFVLFLTGGMGGGDVKLIAAVGCLAGIAHIQFILIFTGLAGGVMALVLIAKRRRFRETFTNVGSLVIHHRIHGLEPHPQINVMNDSALRLPYALAIAAGTAITLCLVIVQR